mmetsp:Transcript_79993/g.152062  ORF Transcript_79993/g.152062 Transcript_79993/m.152062 type:complete len:270 (+) Transcript_79993:72-881(+)
MGCRGSTAAGDLRPQASSSKGCGGPEARQQDYIKGRCVDAGESEECADDASTLPPSGQTSNSSQEALDVSQVVLNEDSFAAVLRAATSLAEGAPRTLRVESSGRPVGNVLRSVLKGVESEDLPRKSFSRRVSFSETPAEIVLVEPLAGYQGILQRSSAVDGFVFRDDDFVINQDPLEMAGVPCRRYGHVSIDADDPDRLLLGCFGTFCCVDQGRGELVMENNYFLPIGAEEEVDIPVAESQVVPFPLPLSSTEVDLDDDLAITGQFVLS